MIVTLTMNPCLDITETIPQFTYGGLNRITERRVDPSGKGINVAMVLQQMGVPVRAVGMNYRENGEAFAARLAERGLDYEYVMAEGAVRENIKLLDLENAVTTEINQNGVPMDPLSLEMMQAKLAGILQEPEVATCVLTGSLPPQVAPSFYRDLITRGKMAGVRMILDAEGEALLEGMKAAPYMIKPNLFEFETAFHPEDTEIPSLVNRAREILQEGIEVILLSMGEKGALLIDAEEAWYTPPVACDVKSTQGAGDSMVAGFCMALEQGLPRKEQLRWASACAAGSLVREGTLLCTPAEFAQFKPRVTACEADCP